MHRAIAAVTRAQCKLKWKHKAKAVLTETPKNPSKLTESGSSHRNRKAKRQLQNEPGRMRTPRFSLLPDEKKPFEGICLHHIPSSKEVTEAKRSRSETLHCCFPPDLTDKLKTNKQNQQNQFITHQTPKPAHVAVWGAAWFCSILMLHPWASTSSSEFSTTQQEMQLQTHTLQHGPLLQAL